MNFVQRCVCACVLALVLVAPPVQVHAGSYVFVELRFSETSEQISSDVVWTAVGLTSSGYNPGSDVTLTRSTIDAVRFVLCFSFVFSLCFLVWFVVGSLGLAFVCVLIAVCCSVLSLFCVGCCLFVC